MLPAAAMAQTSPGPFGGLFGRTPERTGLNVSTIEIRSSVGGQYENALLAAEDEGPDTSVQSGLSSGAAVALIFERRSERLTARLSGSANHQEYYTTPGFAVNLFGAGGQMNAKLTTRVEAAAAASYVHSPYFQFFQTFGQTSFGRSSNVAFDDFLVPFSPYAAQMMENESIDAFAGLTGHLTKRSRLNGSVHRRQTQFAQHPANDFVVDGYRATWNLQVGRGLGVHAGYGREHVEQRGAEGTEFDHEIIDVGVDFNRTLSVTRRTTLGFMTSTSLLKDSRGHRQWSLNGAVTLSKHFRRTWRLAAQASRTTEFLPLFLEPVSSDMLGVSLDGMFSRRVHWIAGASGGRGRALFSERSGFDTVGATSRLSVALSNHLGLYGQYAAYRYDIPNGSTTVALRSRLVRQAVSVGLSAYIPVYTKMRAGQ